MRKEFEMTPDELKKILSACKPTPVMYLSDGTPMLDSPQENSNRAWRALAKEKGFIWDSVHPVSGKGSAFFTAEECAAEPVESPVTSANIARDEIAAIIAQHFSCDASGKFLGVYSVEELYNKLRQLSPVA